MSQYKSFSKPEGAKLLGGNSQAGRSFNNGNSRRSVAATTATGVASSVNNANNNNNNKSVNNAGDSNNNNNNKSETPSQEATLEAAAHLMRLAPLPFDPKLDFLANNRVVAVLEKAIERLQLLGLLDVSGPPEVAAAAGKGATGGGKLGSSAAAAAATGPQLLGTRNTNGVRGPAVLAGGGGGAEGETGGGGAAAAGAGGGGGGVFSAEERAAMRKTAPGVSAALAAAAAETEGRGRATVAEMLAEQRRLEKRYGELLRETRRVEPPPAEPQLDTRVVYHHHRDPEALARQQELRAVTAKLKAHHRLLCTQLRDNPNDVDNWHKISNEREELMMLLQAAVAEMLSGYDEASSARRGGGNGANSNLNGSSTFRNAASATLNGSVAALMRTASGRSLTSNQLPASGSAAGDDVASSQAPALLKRFGSTMQLRRATKTTANAPRVPLMSSYNGLARKVAEERAAQRWADALLKKERELNQNVKQLQTDLLHERNLREREMAERRARLATLRGQLRDLKRTLRERSEAAKARAAAAAEGQQRRVHEQDRAVTERMTRAERLLAVEQRTTELFRQHLQARAGAMDALGQQWDRKNQTELKRLEMEKMDTQQLRQTTADRLAECERQAAEAADERDARAEATRQEAEEQVAAATQREEEYAAASKLESAIKGMLTRAAIAKTLKKKGKKKK